MLFILIRTVEMWLGLRQVGEMTFGKLRAIEAAAGGGPPKPAESAGPPARDVPDQETPVKAEAPEVSLPLEGCLISSILHRLPGHLHCAPVLRSADA